MSLPQDSANRDDHSNAKANGKSSKRIDLLPRLGVVVLHATSFPGKRVNGLIRRECREVCGGAFL